MQAPFLKSISLIALLGTLSLLYFSCGQGKTKSILVKSPSDKLSLEFILDEKGKAGYILYHEDKTIIDSSFLGFEFRDEMAMKSGFKLDGFKTEPFEEKWEMPWGEQREVLNSYTELQVALLHINDSISRPMNLCFRIFDDGIGFRYEFPKQKNIDSLVIMDELTEFNLTGDHDCWWIPGDWDIYEHLYNNTKVSEINAISKRDHPNLAQTYIPYNAVNTPVTMRTDDGLHLSIHEAALTNYAGMTLMVDTVSLKFNSELVGSNRFGYKAKIKLPFVTPWRTIQVAANAGDLIESKLILNLNEENKIGDVSWFEPKKYVGIWWEMHLGFSSWDMEGTNHGATTENAKRYIDFASANNIGGVLVEGWNDGWGAYMGKGEREGAFDFVTPYADYNLKEVVRYAKEKGVELIMHHETSSAVTTYDMQLDTAYALMEELGIHAVKTGYVGTIIPEGEFHHGQWMVNHYHRVLETAAKHKAAVNAHEPIKATGKRRTYPNAISREGLRGQEFNAWAVNGGNPPDHLPTVAFTRMLAGPIDFTPGAFEMELPSKPENQINTTLAHQLALYVILYSPVQMACDLPKNYIDEPGFQFIRDVAVDWEHSIVLNGEIGDFVTIARKDRNTEDWFIGSISDENKRKISLDFSFLPEGNDYKAILYRDGKRAHYQNNKKDLVIDTIPISKQSVFDIDLAPGGGMAMSLSLINTK